ncbi:MAG: DUF2946 family protein [Thermoguttaceae bacterium]|jgi:hypothetical protein
MRICTKNRWLSIAVAVGYALTITTASLFHNHADPGGRCCHGQSLAHAASEACHHGESGGEAPRQNSSQTPTPCPSDGGHCSVCHFLGHKPAPVAEVVPVVAGALVQEVAAPAPVRIVAAAFSAWQSRAPPISA